MVNGLGGTPAMELAIVARRAVETLEGRGLAVERVYLGNFLTALEMAGVSLTLLPVDARAARPARRADRPRRPGRRRRAALARRSAVPPDPSRRWPRRGRRPPPRRRGGPWAAALSRVAGALLAAEPALTAADSAVGDGDLGISLGRGARAILEAIPVLPLDDPSAAARSLGVDAGACPRRDLRAPLRGIPARASAWRWPATRATGHRPCVTAARPSRTWAGRARATGRCSTRWGRPPPPSPPRGRRLPWAEACVRRGRGRPGRRGRPRAWAPPGPVELPRRPRARASGPGGRGGGRLARGHPGVSSYGQGVGRGLSLGVATRRIPGRVADGGLAVQRLRGRSDAIVTVLLNLIGP